MPFFQTKRKVQLYYEIFNEEKDWTPLIFVHGFGSSVNMFQFQIPLLQKYFKLILFDAEGHGKNPRNQNESYDHLIDNTVEDVVSLLDALEINGEIGIIGHSLMGSGIALKYAIDFPERIKFLILLNGGNLRLDSSIRNIFWNLLPQFTRMNFHELILSSLSVLIEKTVPFIRDAIKSSSPNQNDLTNIDQKIQEDIEDMVDHALDPSGILCPTLIVGAELDNFAPAYLSKQLRNQIPNSDLAIVTMAGHLGPSQRWKEYNKVIHQFLQKYNLISSALSTSELQK
jgi:pimeloyl-ACP methyl ester carboxylesterase